MVVTTIPTVGRRRRATGATASVRSGTWGTCAWVAIALSFQIITDRRPAIRPRVSDRPGHSCLRGPEAPEQDDVENREDQQQRDHRIGDGAGVADVEVHEALVVQ